jgi:hypothetical protein
MLSHGSGRDTAKRALVFKVRYRSNEDLYYKINHTIRVCLLGEVRKLYSSLRVLDLEMLAMHDERH